MKMAEVAGAAALAMISTNAAAAAQEPSPAEQASVDAKAIVADVTRILNENYVLPDMRPKLAAALAKGLADGHYSVSDPNVLAERSTPTSMQSRTTAISACIPTRSRQPSLQLVLAAPGRTTRRRRLKRYGSPTA